MILVLMNYIIKEQKISPLPLYILYILVLMNYIIKKEKISWESAWGKW